MITNGARIFLFLFMALQSFAQSEEQRPFVSAASWNYSLGIGYDVPFGDLADRFGSNLAVKGQIERQTGNNWLFGLQYDFMFGNTVKEDVFANYRLDNGQVLGSNSTYATVLQRQRGGFLGLSVGKVFPISAKYKSGIKVSLAGGVFQHNIRVVDDERTFPQLDGDYAKGYDKLARGMGMKQFLGWQYLAEDRRTNFYIGFEFTQGFTSSVRDYDFDTGTATDKSGRFDGTVGLRVGWILPFYAGYEDEEIFY